MKELNDNIALQFYKLAKVYIKNINTNIDKEDLIQSLVLDLSEKYKRLYDESKSKLSTFAFMCFRNYINNMNKSNSRLKRYSVTISLDTPISEEGCSTLIDTISDKTDILNEYTSKEELLKIIEMLNPQSYDYYINGMTQEQISIKYNTNQYSINRIIKQNIENIKNFKNI